MNDVPAISGMTQIDDVIIDLTMRGSNSGVLLRDGRPGVMIAMLDHRAVAQLGPWVLQILQRIGDRCVSDTITDTAVIEQVFAATEADGWAWFELAFGRMNVTLVFITRQAWCDHVIRTLMPMASDHKQYKPKPK